MIPAYEPISTLRIFQTSRFALLVFITIKTPVEEVDIPCIRKGIARISICSGGVTVAGTVTLSKYEEFSDTRWKLAAGGADVEHE